MAAPKIMADQSKTAPPKKTSIRLHIFDSAESASLWFDIFNGVLFIGALLVTIGTWGTIKTAGIKERFPDERIATNEAETRRSIADSDPAKEGTAKANERIADLSTQAEKLRKDTAEANARALEAQLALEKIKSVRTIPATEIPRFVAALSKFEGTNAVIYVASDALEPNVLAGVLGGILKQAKWDAPSYVWSGIGAVVGIIVIGKPDAIAEVGPTCATLVGLLNSVGLDAAIQHWPGNDWGQVGGMLNGLNPPDPFKPPIRIIIGAKPP